MSSKFGLAGGIPERRVRPIWDAIDSRQFKNALKLVTSLLSKYPKSPYALALKALIHERMGKTDEALSVCLDAKELLYKDDLALMDDLTLSTLQIVLQRLDHLDLATSCYAHACGKYPNNLELMMGLFNCYVREYSFVKQQQTAIKMYKLAGEERFLLWAVCSIQLQVLCDKSGEKLLLLAEGLLKKHIASHSMHEPEALMVYISLLEQQSKYNDALEVLSGDLGSLLMIEVDKLRIQGRLLARANDYSAAVDVYKKILELSPDDWECFLHYLGCLLEDDSIWKYFDNIDQIHPTKHIECKFSHLTEEMFDSRISSASDLVQKLQRDAENSNLRGPYLAELEIEKRKFLFGKKNEDKLLESLLQYFLKFGHLACYASDVEAYLQVLSPNKKAGFVEMLVKNSDSSASATKVLGQTTTILKVQELTGNIFGLPTDEIEASAVKLAKLYCQNLSLSKDLDPQESMFGEELLSLISNMLVQLFWRTRDFGYLAEAIMVLELGLTIRGHVWQYKILLLHIYSYVGALPLAFERYKALDVKNILTETVSHHILRQMLESPMWVDLSNLLKDYLKFMDDHLRESADLTFLAYRHRNYSKVIEFVLFKQRLQHSNQYQAARVEASVLQLKQNADSFEEEERILENLKSGVQLVELSNEIGSRTLKFNEDMQTRPWWTPCPEKNYLLGPFEEISYCPPKENVKEEREENMKRAIQRKSLLPRMIYLSIQCTPTALKESVETNGSGGDIDVCEELKCLLEDYTKMLGCSLSDAVEMITEISQGARTSESLGSNLVDWLNFAVFWNAWSLSSQEHWHVLNSLFERLILDRVRSMGSSDMSSCYSDVQVLVQIITEPLAWHSLIIQACTRSSLPSGKKKKKNQHSDQLSSSPISQAIKDSIQSLCSTIQDVSNWLLNQLNNPEDGQVEGFLTTLKRDGNAAGPGQILGVLESFIASSEESEVGNRIFQALKSWNTADTARKTVMAQQRVLREFLQICESKRKLLETLKQQMSHV
ncbi:Tetratricopeptide-like helical domain superfamily [Arabidopsis thaliana x Arabidopsis arenosa]|uniref:Uncharacterized protein n=2 Tax=Arabidopsis TaxID=3701 RepID=A0A178UDL5_ARATH|nr:Tetratricopeptide-like helical domain superfamily [Arabidopsis thaliana x Arabidopsis arenosa]OAO90791.1 hypothetical protein AXX17_AT5G57820 [Arabidopsis thaliana]